MSVPNTRPVTVATGMGNPDGTVTVGDTVLRVPGLTAQTGTYYRLLLAYGSVVAIGPADTGGGSSEYLSATQLVLSSNLITPKVNVYPDNVTPGVGVYPSFVLDEFAGMLYLGRWPDSAGLAISPDGNLWRHTPTGGYAQLLDTTSPSLPPEYRFEASNGSGAGVALGGSVSSPTQVAADPGGGVQVPAATRLVVAWDIDTYAQCASASSGVAQLWPQYRVNGGTWLDMVTSPAWGAVAYKASQPLNVRQHAHAAGVWQHEVTGLVEFRVVGYRSDAFAHTVYLSKFVGRCWMEPTS